MFHRRRRRQWNRNFPEKSLRSPVLDCNCSAANFDGIAGYNWWFCCCFYFLRTTIWRSLFRLHARVVNFADGHCAFVHRFGSSQSLWERKIRLFWLILFAHLRDGNFWYEETPNLLRRRGVRIGWLIGLLMEIVLEKGWYCVHGCLFPPRPNQSLMQCNLSLSLSWLLYLCGGKESLVSTVHVTFPFLTRKRLTLSHNHSVSLQNFHHKSRKRSKI